MVEIYPLPWEEIDQYLSDWQLELNFFIGFASISFPLGELPRAGIEHAIGFYYGILINLGDKTK